MATRSVYRIHPYFNADPSIEYAQSPMGLRYYNKYGGRYIKERDMDHTMHKNDRGGSMQRKRLRQEDLAALPSKSLGRERSMSRSREPSPHSRGDSSARADSFAYIPAHQRDRRIILVSPIRTLAVKNSTIGVERQRVLTTADMTMLKIEIATRTTARTGNGIGMADPSATQGVVAETLRRIVAATPGRRWTITRSARGIHGTRRTTKTHGNSNATPLLTQRGIDQATVGVLKLLMIIPLMRVFRCCTGGY